MKYWLKSENIFSYMKSLLVGQKLRSKLRLTMKSFFSFLSTTALRHKFSLLSNLVKIKTIGLTWNYNMKLECQSTNDSTERSRARYGSPSVLCLHFFQFQRRFGPCPAGFSCFCSMVWYVLPLYNCPKWPTALKYHIFPHINSFSSGTIG